MEKVSRPKQRILFGTVASIAEMVRAAGVQSPALTIVGLARTLAELRGQSDQPPR